MSGKKLNRRDFLRMGALTAAGAVLASCGGDEAEPEMVEVEVTRVVAGTPEQVEVVVTATPEPEMAKEGPALITWWSHWANEPSKRVVIEKIAADYEAEHPDVDIVVTWWDKNPLRDAIRSTMTAGEGAPVPINRLQLCVWPCSKAGGRQQHAVCPAVETVKDVPDQPEVVKMRHPADED